MESGPTLNEAEADMVLAPMHVMHNHVQNLQIQGCACGGGRIGGRREVEGGEGDTVQPCLNVLQPCYLTY